MVFSESDIANREHEETIPAKRVVLFGETSGGSFIEFLVDGSGVLQ